MKKILSGKVYDTATAKLVGDWDNGHFTNYFEYCSESLYRKKSGEFFIHGQGHALSKYAGHSGSNTGWGEKIIPLTYEAAQKWAEEHLDAEDYIALFGEPEKDDSRTKINVCMSSAQADKIKQLAARAGMSLSDYIVSKVLSE